jgi:hypothetical protein
MKTIDENYKPKPGKFKDITGQKFGRLTVTSVYSRDAVGTILWRAVCDCGNAIIARGTALRWGEPKSCGCLRADPLIIATRAAKRRTHGLVGSKEYRAWAHMKGRCLDPGDKAYKYYGGRGITVCERWLKFVNFHADMGSIPSASLSLDRIDVNGCYCPENCRWATPTEQARNKRTSVILEIDSIKKPIAEWASQSGIAYATLRKRIADGWPVYDAVFAPVSTDRKRTVAIREPRS